MSVHHIQLISSSRKLSLSQCHQTLGPCLSQPPLIGWIHHYLLWNNTISETPHMLTTTGLQQSAPGALQQSIIQAHELLGYPHKNQRALTVNDSKWEFKMKAMMTYLSFKIDTQAMVITWPLQKCLNLMREILEVIDHSSPGFSYLIHGGNHSRKPKISGLDCPLGCICILEPL